MTWDDVYILRNEILLTLLVLYQLIADLSEGKDNRNLVNGTLFGFALITAAGIIPTGTSSLFGGMFLSDPLRNLLKFILNLSTLIILLQSAAWLRKPENQSKTGAFYMLIFSTLMGMSFMISSGNFLMLYLGLETATLPLTLLAAFDKKLRRSAEAGIKLLMSSAVSSSVLLMGLSLLYGSYGTLYFTEMAPMTNALPLSVFGLVLFIAINLAVMNMLPLPALDGGRAFLLLVNTVFTAITKKKIPSKFEGYIHAAGMILLLGFIAFITFKDIWKLVR